MLSAALWSAISLLNSWAVLVVESIFFQELMRWALWYLLQSAGKSKLMQTRGEMSRIKEEISIGSGIATAHLTIMYGSILWDAKGTGSYYLGSCEMLPLFVTSAVIGGIISILDVCWTIIAFEGYRTRSYVKIIFVISAHFASSFLVSGKYVGFVWENYVDLGENRVS